MLPPPAGIALRCVRRIVTIGSSTTQRRKATMSDKNLASFNKLVPGFDFLQGLVKNAGQALPSIGQWVAPTLNPEELEKRIEELRTVQFWLEQNARMLAVTIQALEVQRMTLSTLKSMNVPLTALRDSLRVPEADDEAKPLPQDKQTPSRGAGKAPAAEAATPAVDPMQWWGALTKQFTQLATTAMKDGAGDAARTLAGSMVKQSFDAAEETLKKAAQAPRKVAGAMAQAAVKGAKSGAKKRAARR
jgi:prefoldin subunit 5